MSGPDLGPLAQAQVLINTGIPVVICRPNPRWRPDGATPNEPELHHPPGWQTITADACDLSQFRPGIDALALVAGHGIDVVDVDSKAGGSVENLPPFRRFGRNRTPSGGHHDLVVSTGIGQLSPLDVHGRHVGDYCGGTADGGGRRLAYLPGSARPKYPDASYEVEEPLDLAALLESEPDDGLVAALVGAGGSFTGQAGRPAAAHEDVQAFKVNNAVKPERQCNYGRKAIDGLLAESRSVIPGSQVKGRHGWTVRSVARVVELIRAGCCWSGDLDAIEDRLGEIKPEGGTSFQAVLSWALSNANGTTGCGLHKPREDPQEAPGAAQDLGGTLADELARDPALAYLVKEMQRRARAVEIVAEIAARSHPRPAPDCGTLAELLARPDTAKYRIEGLLPAGGRMTATAQRKVGKTTLIGNLARSLLTGEDFLGRFPVVPITGRVIVLNYEVTGAQFARWMADIGVPPDRCYVINLRGRRNLLADAEGRAELVGQIRAQSGEVLVVDPFGRAYTGKSQNDAAEVTPWLVRLDEVAEQAGITEVILTAHAGWDGERTRGSTALEDWPDVIVTMTRDPDSDERFIKAEGRDVDLPEDRLSFDPATRTLALSGDGSRRQVRHDDRLHTRSGGDGHRHRPAGDQYRSHRECPQGRRCPPTEGRREQGISPRRRPRVGAPRPRPTGVLAALSGPLKTPRFLDPRGLENSTTPRGWSRPLGRGWSGVVKAAFHAQNLPRARPPPTTPDHPGGGRHHHPRPPSIEGGW